MSTQRLTPEQNRLVENNLALARHTARAMWERNSRSLDLREMVSIAYQGLVTAALGFDLSRYSKTDKNFDPELAFTGYAKRRIVGTILDWQRSNDHVPRRQRSVYKSLQQAGYGEGRSIQELADEIGLPADKLKSIAHAVEATAVSLEQVPPTWDGNDQYATDVPAPADVESSVLQNSITLEMSDQFAELEELQQIIIAMRYYEGHDLPYISASLGIRLSLVREKHYDAILILHSVMVRAAS